MKLHHKNNGHSTFAKVMITSFLDCDYLVVNTTMGNVGLTYE